MVNEKNPPKRKLPDRRASILTEDFASFGVNSVEDWNRLDFEKKSTVVESLVKVQQEYRQLFVTYEHAEAFARDIGEKIELLQVENEAIKAKADESAGHIQDMSEELTEKTDALENMKAELAEATSSATALQARAQRHKADMESISAARDLAKAAFEKVQADAEDYKLKTNKRIADLSVGLGGFDTHDRRSTASADPNLFSGTKPKELEEFIASMHRKLFMNSDWYRDELHRKTYFLERLEGEAKSLFVPYLDARSLPVNIEDVAKMTEVLELAYGDANKQKDERKQLKEMEQGTMRFTAFLTKWHALALKSGYCNLMLTDQLVEAIHPTLHKKFAWEKNPPAELSPLIELLKELDASIRSVEGDDYAKKGARFRIKEHKWHKNDGSAKAPVVVDEDVNVLEWVPAPDKRPKNEEERRARKAYCIKNKLCYVCDSRDHGASQCPKSYINRNKAIAADTTGAGNVEGKV